MRSATLRWTRKYGVASLRGGNADWLSTPHAGAIARQPSPARLSDAAAAFAPYRYRQSRFEFFGLVTNFLVFAGLNLCDPLLACGHCHIKLFTTLY